MATSREAVVGIDLGTTYSCVAVYHNGKVKVIPNDHGNNLTPSVVSFTASGCLIGEDAKYRLSLFPDNTVYDTKRLIGRDYNDRTLANDIRHWPFKVVEVDGKPHIHMENQFQKKIFSPEEIGGIILGKLKDIAEDHLNMPVNSAVITVPAYFNESQRQATKIAADLAGLKVLRIINEPTAASLAFNNQLRHSGAMYDSDVRTILIYDLGGGTFDVSIIEIIDNSHQVLASKGDSHLGGSDFDNNMADFLFDRFGQNSKKKRSSIYSLSEDEKRMALVRLRRKCEEAKCLLSRKTNASFMVDSFHKHIDYNATITKEEFENLNEKLIRSTIPILQAALNDAHKTCEEIDEVVLVGGSTRIPLVRQLIAEIFGQHKLNHSVDPDVAVAHGAAIQAAILTQTDDQDQYLTTACLNDVTPFTMGVAEINDVMSPIITKNTMIPYSKTAKYSTTVANQTYISVKVYQGESQRASDNHFLGKFTVDKLRPQQAGQVVFDITFEISADGTLEVTAKEHGGASGNTMKIQNEKLYTSLRTRETLKQGMLSYLHEDRTEKVNIEARNKLETYANWMKHIAENVHRESRISLIEHTLTWLNTVIVASKDVYEMKLIDLKFACRGIPQKYQTPGVLLRTDQINRRGTVYENIGDIFGDITSSTESNTYISMMRQPYGTSGNFLVDEGID